MTYKVFLMKNIQEADLNEKSWKFYIQKTWKKYGNNIWKEIKNYKVWWYWKRKIQISPT